MICHVWVIGGQRKGHSKCSLERTARMSSVSSVPICSISWSSGIWITLDVDPRGFIQSRRGPLPDGYVKAVVLLPAGDLQCSTDKCPVPVYDDREDLEHFGLILEIDPGSPNGPLFHRTHSQSSGRMSLPRSSIRPSDSRRPIASRV